MLKMKLQHFGHLMQSSDSLKETMMPGRIEGRRKRGGQRMKLLDGITDSMDRSLTKAKPGVCSSLHEIFPWWL